MSQSGPEASPGGSTAATLVEWVASHGGHLHPGVEVYRDEATGLSLRARQDCAGIAPLEPIVRLPTVLSLSFLNASGRPGPDMVCSSQGKPEEEQRDRHQQDDDGNPQSFPPDFVSRTPPHVVGRVFLAREFLRGTRSPWWPYIATLAHPDDEAAWKLPPFWEDAEIELFAGTNMEAGIARIRADVAREWAAARALLEELRGRGDGAVDADLMAVTEGLYRWAFCVFSSRSFRPALVLPQGEWSLPPGVGIDDFSVLLPLLDIGNHDMTAAARWVVSEEEEGGEGRGEGQGQGQGQGQGEGGGPCASGFVELRVDRAHEAGQQVFNNYSMKTNTELLLGYGFMLPATGALHNDYVHERRRGGKAGEEWLISLRAISDPSSALVRAREGFDGKEEEEEVGDERDSPLRCFERVQAGMVWDIFKMMVGEGYEALVPLDGEGDEDMGEREAEDERRRRFLAGRVTEDGWEALGMTVQVIYSKLAEELKRLERVEGRLTGDESVLSPRQRLIRVYWGSCRRVLEGCIDTMEVDVEDHDEVM